MQRRKFLQQGGILATGMGIGMPAIHNSFATEKLLQSLTGTGNMFTNLLYRRGKVTSYLKSKNELQYIGMPVGGINCGTLYLGGDGRLWLWDIFNTNQEGIEPKEVDWPTEVHAGRKIRSRDGACYIAPAKDIRPLEQGFAVTIKYKGHTIIKRFHYDDWKEIIFEATYPAAVVHYIDPAVPVQIKLKAFSPFIPLDEDNSNIPVTIQSFEIKNTGNAPVDIEITGWLENAVNKFSAKNADDGKRINRTVKAQHHTSVEALFVAGDAGKFAEAGDTGSMCLSLVGNAGKAKTSVSLPFNGASFTTGDTTETIAKANQPLMAGVQVSRHILPGKTDVCEFMISWHFPNVGKRINIPDARTGHYYLNKFKNAVAVADYVAAHYKELSAATQQWAKTWYDATLPWWFMERTFLNISAMATTTSHRFKTGRSWAWEGVGACEGNCTHVWQYAQALGRIFPAIERDNRQRVDLGISLQQDGGIWFRGEYDKRPAIDGQAGRILGCLREHQMSADNTFLQHNWPAIKKAVEFVIQQDKNNDGMTDTPMENTLDAVWDGEIAWIVGLCIAAVKAGGVMAEEMNDSKFAVTCKAYVEKGSRNMDEKLFNGEYYIHRPDAVKGRTGIGSYNTCHIDQVFGQSWAWQLNLGRINDKAKTKTALQALWKYNFKNDVGPYLKEHTGWRPYALPGEAGMVMNTNPANEPNPFGNSVTWQMGYFHECMTGFEHQVASHLMAEGMTDEAMLLTKAVHDRYHAVKRNPFNEIECSDHYGRAMASYGTFITACGFRYHGPQQLIGFAPQISPEDFKAPFTAAQGWGSYVQKRNKKSLTASLQLAYGKLHLKTIQLELDADHHPKKLTVLLNGNKVAAVMQINGQDVKIVLANTVLIEKGQTIAAELV